MTGRGRLTLLAVALATGALLGGCGGDEEGGQEGRTATQEQEQGQAATDTGQTQDAGAGGNGPGADGRVTLRRPFAPDSPWNTPVVGEPTDPNSDELIRLAQERVGVIETGEDFRLRTERRRLDDPLYINTRAWTVPVVDEENGVPTRMVCRQSALPAQCGDGQFVETLRVPPDVDPLPQYDGWFTVLDRANGHAYDLWRARRGREGDVISYQFMRRWELDGPGFLFPGEVSARGSGLPLFAGLITPEAIESGRIEHALAISVPGPAQRRYVQPASTTDGGGRLTSLPEGARIRLREDLRLEDLIGRRSPRCDTIEERAELDDDDRRRLCRPYRFPSRTNRQAARAILEALRTYGAIVVDRARVPTLYAQLNADWDAPVRRTEDRALADGGEPRRRDAEDGEPQRTPLLRGNEVQGLRLSDFEVVRLPPLRNYPSLSEIEPPPLLGRVRPQPTVRQERRQDRRGQATTTPQARTPTAEEER